METHLTSHKTRRIPLKMIDVDVAMVPIIQWINQNIHGITLSCCHGNERPKLQWEKPYVTIFTNIPDDMKTIWRSIVEAGLLGYIQLEIFWQGINNENLLYRLTFNSRDIVRRYAKYLKGGGKP